MKISTICFPVRDNQLFLANKKRGFGAGLLNGYEGKKQPEDVSVEATAIRELTEEGGITTSPDKLEKVAVIDFFEGDKHIFECHVFFCRDWQGEFAETEEMEAPRPYDISNPPYEQMWSADTTWLPLVCSGQKIRAKSFYNESMTQHERLEHEPL